MMNSTCPFNCVQAFQLGARPENADLRIFPDISIQSFSASAAKGSSLQTFLSELSKEWLSESHSGGWEVCDH